jgi:hypothetical protein
MQFWQNYEKGEEKTRKVKESGNRKKSEVKLFAMKEKQPRS